MVQILHVYLKKIHQLISYVFLAEKKILYFFQWFKGEKKFHDRFFFSFEFEPLEKHTRFFLC
jgi:hypothetical protein